jgi:hypothetical protein
MMKRIILGLVTPVAMLCSTISWAQLKHVDHVTAAIERDEFMCLNMSGEPARCQTWFASLKASDFSDHNDRAPPTEDSSVGPSTRTAFRPVDEFTCVNRSDEPVTCQVWLPSLNFSDYSERVRPTGDFSVAASTKAAIRAGTSGSPNGTAKSSERYAAVYEAHHGLVRRGDELPVRHVSTVAAPELDSTFATSAVALVAGCVAILRVRRRKVARQ